VSELNRITVRLKSDRCPKTVGIRTSGAPIIAERLGMSMVHKALTLSTLPERGRVVPELGLPDVREIIFRTYRIIYRQ
jgi:plasmid stabilization system protein ParE